MKDRDLDCHASAGLVPLAIPGLPVLEYKPSSAPFHVLVTVKGKPMADPDDRPGERRRTEAEHMELVLRCALAMRRKLNLNAHKEHWRLLTPEYLLKRLQREMAELEGAMALGDPAAIRDESTDVMILAAMLYDRHRR